MVDLQPINEAFWRTSSVQQGQALEAYGRILAAYGRGEIPSEIFARDLANAGTYFAEDVLMSSLRFGWEYYRWGWSIIGVRIDPGKPPASPSTAGRTTV